MTQNEARGLLPLFILSAVSAVVVKNVNYCARRGKCFLSEI